MCLFSWELQLAPSQARTASPHERRILYEAWGRTFPNELPRLKRKQIFQFRQEHTTLMPQYNFMRSIYSTLLYAARQAVCRILNDMCFSGRSHPGALTLSSRSCVTSQISGKPVSAYLAP